MKDTFKDYSKIILNNFLRLKKGDALSVNTEECNLEEAKFLANEAINITGANVKIVVTKGGRPEDVIEFDAPDQLTTKVTGLAMVRLVNESDFSIDSPESIDKENLPLIQKLGHLAQPLEIGRKIVVPWCVISLDGAYTKSPAETDKLLTEVTYRQEYMRHMDIHELNFIGKNTDFKIELPEDVWFIGGNQNLSNGRSYLTGPDFDRLRFTVDKNSLDGRFTARIKVCGRVIENSFEYKKGRLVSPITDPFLSRILDFDEEIKLPGMISLRDGEGLLYLGGSDTVSLPEIPEKDEDIPENFNKSLYSIVCELEHDLTVCAIDCEGKSKDLLRKGYFVE